MNDSGTILSISTVIVAFMLPLTINFLLNWTRSAYETLEDVKKLRQKFREGVKKQRKSEVESALAKLEKINSEEQKLKEITKNLRCYIVGFFLVIFVCWFMCVVVFLFFKNVCLLKIFFLVETIALALYYVLTSFKLQPIPTLNKVKRILLSMSQGDRE